MLNNSLYIISCGAQVLSGIEMIRMSSHMLSDTSSQSKTKIGVDVDLAYSHLSCLTKLIFGNADGIL